MKAHDSEHVYSYTYLMYKARYELGIINSFIATSVFIIVSMTLDRFEPVQTGLRLSLSIGAWNECKKGRIFHVKIVQ